MTIVNIVVLWVTTGLLTFPLVLWVGHKGSADLGTDAVGIVAGFVVLLICALLGPLGLASFLLLLLLRLLPKKPLRLDEEIDCDEQTIIQMLVERSKVDERLRREPHPSNWPMFDLWMTDEAEIFRKVDGLLWRADAETYEYSEDELISQVLESPPTPGSTHPELLGKQVRLAAKWVRSEIKAAKKEKNFPGPDCWGAALQQKDIEKLDQAFVADGHPTKSWCEWRKLKGRMSPGDSIRRFDNGPRAGVLLARGERSIARVDLEFRCY